HSLPEGRLAIKPLRGAVSLIFVILRTLIRARPFMVLPFSTVFMESIAALGLACNIFQIISFGNETIRLVRDVYSRGFLETPLAEHAVTLRDVASHIIAFETPVNPRKYEVQLKDNATKCHAVARDLVEEIKLLLSERAKGDLAGTLKVVSKVAWRKRRLERLEKQLCAVEKQMQTGLLVRVWYILIGSNGLNLLVCLTSRML
ncbi:hypothetical protein CCHR01_09495, partial [Colletotrichum chrysophilum]